MSNTNVPRASRFIPHPDDDAVLWGVKEITEESASQYKVVWDGLDPETGKPWEPSWVDKSDCTDLAVARWEANKGRVESEDVGSRNTKSTSGSKNEQQARPAGKRKRQCEGTQDEDRLQDAGPKSRKRAPRNPPRTVNAHHSPTVQASPSTKFGPPRGAKRSEPTTSKDSSITSTQTSSQVIFKAPYPGQSSKAMTSLMNPALLRREEEESSEDDLHCSQDAPPISTAIDSGKNENLPPRALENHKTLPTSQSAERNSEHANLDVPRLAKTSSSHSEFSSSSSLLQKMKEMRELQFGISKASNISLKLALESAPTPGPYPNTEEIKLLQCEISIASNSTLKLLLEAMEMLGREYS